MIPDGSPLGAGSPSHAAAAATAAALTSERFAGLIILITGARNVTDYAAAHKGRPQSLPLEIIIIMQFACGSTEVPLCRYIVSNIYETAAILVSSCKRGR